MAETTSIGFRAIVVTVSVAAHAAAFMAVGRATEAETRPFALPEINAPSVDSSPSVDLLESPSSPESAVLRSAGIVSRHALAQRVAFAPSRERPLGSGVTAREPLTAAPPPVAPQPPTAADALPPNAARAPLSAPPVARFVMAIANEPVAQIALSGADSSAERSGESGVPRGGAFAESQVAVRAHALNAVLPMYPPQARAQEIEADVVVEFVVDANGAVRDARVAKRAGYGLDEAAIGALLATRFAPARLGERPVAVRMRHAVCFRLR